MRKRITKVITILLTVILTAKAGRITFNEHYETYYNLNMSRIVERADAFYGLTDVYEIREDGVKTYNGFVICAADWNVHPFGSVVETSRGLGIVLDTGAFTKKEPQTVDIAADW